MNDIIGSIAAVLTTASFLPQAYKIFKTKETKAISLAMFAILNTGNIFWLIYGFLTTQYPIIFANLITLTLSGYILFIKVKNMRNGNDK